MTGNNTHAPLPVADLIEPPPPTAQPEAHVFYSLFTADAVYAHADLSAAKMCGLFAARLGRPYGRRRMGVLVTATWGVSFRTFLARWRVMEACRLLQRCPTISVADVMTLVGYDERRSFNFAFRAHVGIAPSDYRDCAAAALQSQTRDEAVPGPQPPVRTASKNALAQPRRHRFGIAIRSRQIYF